MVTTEDLLRDLALAWPKARVGTEQLAVYERELQDIPTDVLAATIRRLIRTEEFFPTVTKIRRAAVERRLRLPTEAEALASIDARLVWGRSKAAVMPEVHPLVKECLARVGGFPAVRESEDPTVIRGQFGRLYREAREALIHEQVAQDWQNDA